MQENRWSGWNIIALAMLAIAMAAGFPLSGCGEDNVDDPGDAQLGALEIKHTITVSEVIYPQRPGDDLALPEPGMQYALVKVVIRNESSRELIFSSANLKLETREGSTYNYDFDFDSEDMLAAVTTVGPGAEVAGGVAFEIPVGHQPAALIEEIDGQQHRIELPRAKPSTTRI